MEAWLEWTKAVGVAVAVSLITFWGIGGLLHRHFYGRRRGEAARWKAQPERWLSPALARSAFWLGSGNIVLGAVVGGTFGWHVSRGGASALYFDLHEHGLVWLGASAVLVFFAVDAGLYYSHRLFHRRALFRAIHRWHHKYTAPNVFTTTATHPVEFLVFEAALILPAMIIPTHWAVYLLVILYTYFIGMVDHCGVRVPWRLPLHPGNAFHEEHHIYFHCNFGHHTQLFDRLHGTVRRGDRHYDIDTFEGDTFKGDGAVPAEGGDGASASSV